MNVGDPEGLDLGQPEPDMMANVDVDQLEDGLVREIQRCEEADQVHLAEVEELDEFDNNPPGADDIPAAEVDPPVARDDVNVEVKGGMGNQQLLGLSLFIFHWVFDFYQALALSSPTCNRRTEEGGYILSQTESHSRCYCVDCSSTAVRGYFGGSNCSGSKPCGYCFEPNLIFLITVSFNF